MKKLMSFKDFPKDIAGVLRRADALCEYDRVTDTLYITSQNGKAPLTTDEKIRISVYLITTKRMYSKVVFE